MIAWKNDENIYLWGLKKNIVIYWNMATKQDNRLAWGVSLLVFGCLFLLRQLNIVPTNVAGYIFDIRTYLLIIGIIFLICHNIKTIGWILIILGVLFRVPDIVKVTQSFSDYIWPALFILAGTILVFMKKK